MYVSNKNKIINKILLFAFSTGFMILYPVLLFAQDNTCQDGSGVTGNNPDCPLDTWVWVLVAAAAIFGVIKLYARKNEQKQYS